MAIYQGSTPTHYFEIPISGSKVKDVEIAYEQNERVILIKETADCTITENEVIVKLSQEDTFLFDKNYPVKIQIRLLDYNDNVLPSDEITKSVKRCLSKEVL